MIISLVRCPANSYLLKNWLNCVQDNLDKIALNEEIHKFREYKIVADYTEHWIRIPIRVQESTGDVHALWPAGLLYRRKYPLAVYLYAVDLYISTDLSMRKVAEATRKEFGLEKFSHSTVSRTLKKLLNLISTIYSVENDLPLELLRTLLTGVRENPMYCSQKLAYDIFDKYHLTIL